jgi:hypothetical protein
MPSASGCLTTHGGIDGSRVDANYDSAIGTKSFRYLIRLSAQLLIVEREFAKAMKVLSSIDPAALPARLHAVHHADQAVCTLSLGDEDAAALHATRSLI